jgi:hypothetical protein
MRANLRIRRLIVPILIAIVAVLALPSASGASTISSHSVPGLKHCTESRSCDIKNANLHFVNYSSVCKYSNCNFVAAADWEKIALHTQPSANLIKSEYKAAHQTFGGGLHMPDLWSYWKKSGIDGAYAKKVSVWTHSQDAVQNGVLDFGSMITELKVSKDSPLARQLGRFGTIIATVDGFDPTGPLVVFRARTTQTTWLQWKTSVRALWGITTSHYPPTPPATTKTTVPPPTTTTTVVPPPTTTTVVPTVVVTFSANGGSGFMSNETEPLGSVAALSLNSFVYPGYSFAGWNTSPSGAGTNYSDGATYSFTTDTTLYAQWTAASTTATFTGTTSPNWSGYVVPSSSAIITYAEGEWTVPTMNCADTPNGDVATWVGIGGTSSTVLLQTGVTTNCLNGAQQTFGWWEEFPSTPNTSQAFAGFPVAPGDEIKAIVAQNSNGSWETTVSDLTTGLSGYMITGEAWGVSQTGAPSFTSQGSTAALSYSGGYTAEWIVEDPGVANSTSYYPFANYGSVTFTNLETDLSSWSLPPSDGWEIQQNGIVLSVPSAVTSTGFTVNYTGP